MAKKRTLNIGRQIEVWSGVTPPKVGGHPMTVGTLLLQMIPMLPGGENYMRFWNIGLEIDKAIGAGQDTIQLSDLDWKMLKGAVLAGDREVWVKANLENAFVEGD